MESSQAWENSKIELYCLFKKLADATGDERRETAGAIIVHEVLKRSLRLACGMVLKRLPGHSDLRDDLLQETTFLLFSDLIHGKIKYCDQGSHAFLSWLREMIYRTALDALHGLHAISLDQPDLMKTEELDSLVFEVGTKLSLDDVLIAVSRIKPERTQRVLRDWILGKSLAESARKTGLSISTVCRIRQRGLDELRRELSID